MVKKKIGVKILLLAITILLFQPLLTTETSAANTKQRIFDEAGLLTEKEISELEEIAEVSSVNRETDFIILTTKDAGGKDVTKYMQDLYDEKEFGYHQAHGSAVIVAIKMNGRDIDLAGFKKAETYLDNERLTLIREKITPDLSNENYFNAFETFIKTGDKYMGYRPGVNPENILFKWWFQAVVSFGIASVIIGSMVYNSGGKVTTNAGTYRDSNHSKVVRKKDRYLRKTVTKRRKPKPTKNGGSGRGGGGGMTSGGHSHSGSRGKF